MPAMMWANAWVHALASRAFALVNAKGTVNAFLTAQQLMVVVWLAATKIVDCLTLCSKGRCAIKLRSVPELER